MYSFVQTMFGADACYETVMTVTTVMMATARHLLDNLGVGGTSIVDMSSYISYILCICNSLCLIMRYGQRSTSPLPAVQISSVLGDRIAVDLIEYQQCLTS